MILYRRLKIHRKRKPTNRTRKINMSKAVLTFYIIQNHRHLIEFIYLDT